MAAAPQTRNSRVPTAFEISQLHDKPAPQWEKKLRELDDEKTFRILEYLPLRKAIIADLEAPGTGAKVLAEELDGYNSGFSTDAMIATMREGFKRFMEKNRKQITEIYSENVRRPETYLVRIGNGDVKTAIHAEVEHARYGRKLLFIYASKYSKAETNALQEFLVMLAQQRDGKSPEDVLWLDIRTGTISKLKSRVTVRATLVETVNHYRKLF